MNLELHAGQSRIVSDLFVEQSCRYAVVCASRGFGKSYLAATTAILAVQELMQLGPEVPNKNVAIIAPTYSQCVDIYFPLLAYQFGLADYADKHSAHSGTFWFPNDVVLKLWSYEASERMRGSGQYFVVCDEVTSWRGAGSTLKESWESVVQPCITTRWSRQNSERVGAASPGRALIISTPQGHDTFYDMYNNQERDPEWKSYHFTYHHSPYLDPVEIEKTKHTIDALKFQREYEASFEDSGNTVFYNFKRANNVRNDLEYFKKDEDVHIAIDFNVNIMASIVFAVRGGQMHILDEFQGNADTETLAKAIVKKYPGHKIITYPDPSGRARKSSAAVGRTDFSILKSFGFATIARSKAPPMADSVQAVNRMLLTADGANHLYVHPRCKGTIQSIERTAWTENSPDIMRIDKSAGVEHFSDSLRYATEFLFPVRAGAKTTKQGFGF